MIEIVNLVVYFSYHLTVCQIYREYNMPFYIFNLFLYIPGDKKILAYLEICIFKNIHFHKHSMLKYFLTISFYI